MLIFVPNSPMWNSGPCFLSSSLTSLFFFFSSFLEETPVLGISPLFHISPDYWWLFSLWHSKWLMPLFFFTLLLRGETCHLCSLSSNALWWELRQGEPYMLDSELFFSKLLLFLHIKVYLVFELVDYHLIMCCVEIFVWAKPVKTTESLTLQRKLIHTSWQFDFLKRLLR